MTECLAEAIFWLAAQAGRPFWSADGREIEWREDRQFVHPPHENDVRIAVLALNLLKPLTHVKREAAGKLRNWLSESIAAPYSTPSTGK